MSSTSIPLSVVILTHNESRNLPDCIRSVQPHVSDVHVLDSESTDDTVAIASEMGCHVHSHPFSGFGTQRNWAIDHIPHAHDWVFHLDADERFTPALATEICQKLQSHATVCGYFVANKLLLGRTWLRYSSGFPVYQLRFFDRRRVRFADCGHGQRELVDGDTGYLTEPYLHYGFSKGLNDWLGKHARYAGEEARLWGDAEWSWQAMLGGIIAGTSVERRRAIKAIAFRMPFRPTMRWLYCLFVCRGILDGRAGLTYAKMMRLYEEMIDVHREWSRYDDA